MSEDDFNTWLTFLTDRIEAFTDTLDPGLRQAFDFSPESLRVVGDVIVSGKLGSAAADPRSDLFADFYSYVAEVFHRNLGTQFVLPKDPNDPAFGQPSMRDPSGPHVSLPGVISETARRRDPNWIYDTFTRMRDGWIRAGQKRQ
jgi:hypothetical protein